MPKPPEIKGGRGSKEQKEKLKKEWTKKAHEKLSTQQLGEGDIVMLLDKLYAGRRACIIQTRGVPGLNRIRVSLESNGEVLEVNKVDAIIVKEDDLQAKPYSYSAKEAVEAREMKDREKRRENVMGSHSEGKSKDKDRDRNRDKDRDRKRDREKDRHKDGDTDRYREKDRDNETKGKKRGRDEKDGSISDERKTSWLREGIRVKIISKRLGSQNYLQKANVLDVYGKVHNHVLPSSTEFHCICHFNEFSL